MTARACPICGQPAEADHRPFCSLRCANVDLQRWLTGGYRLDPERAEGGGGEAPAASSNEDEAVTDRSPPVPHGGSTPKGGGGRRLPGGSKKIRNAL